MGDQGDTYGYRNQAEIESWMNKCPIKRFTGVLVENDIATRAELEVIDSEVQLLIDEAVEYAKQAPYPDPSEVYEHVYA